MEIASFYSIFLQSSSVVIDSRKVSEGAIFFAFSGDSFNAATLAKGAVENGALAVIVEDKEYENKDRNIFYVESTEKFLQDLASYHRERLEIPIIGLTGSNGKTTTKELISTVVARKYKVQYTFGNLNNHLGVPLTLLSIRSEHDIAVVEMGANHQKEIEFLCSLARPTYGYITNFGKAHLEGFGGIEGVIKGKSELYDYLRSSKGTVLVNTMDPLQVEKTRDITPKITFGSNDSDYNFTALSKDNRVGIKYENHEIISNLTGAYNFTNIAAAVSLGLYFGVSVEEIAKAISSYTPQNMRSQIIQKGDKTLVLDTYNANPSSMALALENFAGFSGTKTVILGDMLELGSHSREEHQKIYNQALALQFENIITVGKEFQQVNSEGFLNAKDLIAALQQTPINTNNVLIKGSRGIQLETALESI